ncbi:MAG: translation elongation factor Ts, partial [Gemmataceae bacterium]|nr:translation elongation factor Ts [Gemmataceae bacterium]
FPMSINAADVMKLRDRTGMQMMKCKDALTRAGGDMEKAIELLRSENKAVTVKLGERETGEGRIGVSIEGGNGGIIELRCESAPVAKNEHFVKLATDLARHVAHKEPKTADEMLAQPLAGDEKKTVGDRIAELVGLMRENVKIKRMAKLTGTLASYIHHDGSVGVLIAVEGTPKDAQVLKDVCMHAAATPSMAALREQVPQERVDKEMAFVRGQVEEQAKNKPADIITKIAEGKMRTWYESIVLNEQKFVKDETKTVGQVLEANGVKLKGFVRFKVGEVLA